MAVDPPLVLLEVFPPLQQQYLPLLPPERERETEREIEIERESEREGEKGQVSDRRLGKKGQRKKKNGLEREGQMVNQVNLAVSISYLTLIGGQKGNLTFLYCMALC